MEGTSDEETPGPDDRTGGDGPGGEPHPEDSPTGQAYPLFPLNHVVFPGAQVPLHVFEERYRVLVGELLARPDPATRLFATTSIRQGYEVGPTAHQTLHRIGCVLQLVEAEESDDGTWDVVAVARHRFVLHGTETTGAYPVVWAETLHDDAEDVPAATVEMARSAFVAYRNAVSEFLADPFSGTLPRDPEYLSWTLSALAPLPMPHQQRLLEAPGAAERLELVAAWLREEVRAVRAIASVPASRVATGAWSPN